MTPEPRSEGGTSDAVEAATQALAEAREAVAVAERTLGAVESDGAEQSGESGAETPETTWRTQLWTAPSEVRIGLEELTTALAVSESWIYQRTREDADPRLPHCKLAGSLVFRVGEVRAWIRDNEQVIKAYRSDPAPGELRAVEGGAS